MRKHFHPDSILYHVFPAPGFSKLMNKIIHFHLNRRRLKEVWRCLLPAVMYCSDPGHVEHASRTLSDPKLLVGTTIQYSCSAGFILQGGATITCYGREPGTPVWTSRLPHCVCEYQNKHRRWHRGGASGSDLAPLGKDLHQVLHLEKFNLLRS